ncbi:calcium-activated chloride channel regulator 1-like isoform X2 [Sceloporus undulatus]|nr:calcium-activated chloride channel regulator 1-like isoform X2 [Sceloporus undulatus]XP_042318341.1 calcium-activated chloride channel regulator 1-like isoform X2 [Sceloporus undulatus]
MLNLWHLLMVVVLLHEGSKGTLVKLNNGGFEDVVIGINPGLPEDNKIINNIQDMVKEASSYLFKASEQRFYFKTIKIVIPSTWTSKPEYRRVTRESYDNADVIVAEPFLKYGDDPYTLQYGGCAKQGRYIHFTPNFMTNDSLRDFYGSRGKVLVHEWAHLRWGVFDEYNKDAPFYSTGGKKAEATRCSADITGQYIFQTSMGKTRKCKIVRETQLYEPGCQFIPNKKQKSPASIMYMQSLSSITQFCDKSSHNIKAPNMQNRMCSYRSTWEVIMNSTDFATSSPISTLPPEPTISLMQMRERTVCLVLDVSGSMSRNNRISRLKQAAELFILQIIEMGSWLGIVTSNNEATIKTDLQHIVNDSVRQSLTGYLPITASGGTNICDGVLTGFQVFLQKYTSTEGCEIVLLTDGEDTAVSSCFPKVRSSGSIIHTIALGPEAAKNLEKLAEMTGGLMFSVTDSLDSNGLIDAFSGISSGSGIISQQSIQLESKGETIGPMKWLDGTIIIDKTVGNDTFFLITWSAGKKAPGIFLTDPKGKKYTTTDFAVDNTNVRTARLKIPGTAKTGNWYYSILNTHTAAQVISITVTTRAASANVPPVTVKSYISSNSNNFPNPMIIYAEVTQGFLPVVDANVIATVESASGISSDLELFDNGLGADIIKHDGIYSRYFTSFKENGRYSIKVRVQGKDKTVRRTRRQSQAIYVPGYVDNGVIILNPPRPNTTVDENPNIGSFNRTTSGGSIVVTDVPTVIPSDVFPPSKITDLQVDFNDHEFFLTWTAPGDDYDSGKAERYEIKKSENPLELTDATFPKATSVNTSDLIPKDAGVKEFFWYKPENFSKKNAASVYFAIRAIDDNNNVGEVSNIAKVSLNLDVLPSTPTSFTTTAPKNSSSNTFTTTMIIVCLLVVISAIVLITIYTSRKPRNRRPETNI